MRNAIFVASALLLVACAEEREPIDRVQPNGLRKAVFQGEFYYGRTVVDVPAANGFTHVGDTDYGGMQKVRWDIQEDYLYARRTFELIEGGDRRAEAGDDYEGEVVAAFRVEKHFDIANAYNPSTGERLNIREENAIDRPWYEREYVRVDWSQSLVHDYRLSWDRETLESIPYFVQETDPDTGERNPDAPLFEPDGSYFDVTSRIFAKAGTIPYPGFGEIPVCWLFTNPFDECGAGEFSIRHAFWRIDPDHYYEPLEFKGGETDTFGYFTTDRLTYDRRQGIRQQNKKRYLNRHGIWRLDADGERAPKPIVYHVNRDFPDDLKPVAHSVADQWNQVFLDSVAAVRADLPEAERFEMPGRMFVLCPNSPVEDGDPSECGAAGTAPRLGDIRYSFMAYVPKYMTYGLLGLGPSNTDPETGEILSGMAYVYHHNDNAAYRVQEMLELLNGSRDAADFINGVDLTEWRERARSGESMATYYGLDDADFMVDRIANGKAADYWTQDRALPTPEAFAEQKAMGIDEWLAPYLGEMHREGILNGERHSPDGRLRALAGTYIEDLLVDDEMLLAMGHDPNLPVDADALARASVARGGFGKLMRQRQAALEALAEQRNKYLPEMADDALMGLARELKDADGDEVYERARTAIYTAVLAHEVGHSLGLMHNFGGSDDAINYHDGYWKLRDDGDVGPRLTDPISRAEIDGQIYNYAYSSVMDYAGRYTIDGFGIGKYDRAAILFGYARKMEVFKDTAGVPDEWLRDWFERDGDILLIGNTGFRAVHYTSFYNEMGSKLYDADNRLLLDVALFGERGDTAVVEGADGVETTYRRVPYIYCSHSRANLGDSCLTRDFGADSYERMKNILDELATWYITRSFPRGIVGVDQWTYVSRWYGRIYDRLKSWHDLYGLYTQLFTRFGAGPILETFLKDPVNGWGGQTWAVQNAFNYLVQTVLMPNVGDYGGPYLNLDGTVSMVQNVAGANVALGVDQARYFSTSWQAPGRDCGYEWFECLHHIGFYLDKVMAIEALSDSSTNFVARATPEDLREWEVGYYTTFSEQIGRLNTAIMSGDFVEVGPYVGFGGTLAFPNYAGEMNERHIQPIDPYATFTVQLYWQVLGQARFLTTFDQSFLDESRVFVLGSGNDFELDPERRVTFVDPSTGITYAALRYPARAGAAEAAIERANTLLRRSTFCDEDERTVKAGDDCEPGFSQTLRFRADVDLLDHIELLKVLTDLTPVMQTGDPFDL